MVIARREERPKRGGGGAVAIQRLGLRLCARSTGLELNWPPLLECLVEKAPQLRLAVGETVILLPPPPFSTE